MTSLTYHLPQPCLQTRWDQTLALRREPGSVCEMVLPRGSAQQMCIVSRPCWQRQGCSQPTGHLQSPGSLPPFPFLPLAALSGLRRWPAGGGLIHTWGLAGAGLGLAWQLCPLQSAHLLHPFCTLFFSLWISWGPSISAQTPSET